MKKFLLTAALVLALVTSLTAGTMAYYSTTIGTIDTKNVTKQFSLTADKSSTNYSTVVKLAPGDEAVYTINVTNASEVNMITKFVATLKDNTAKLPGLHVTVARDAGNKDSKDSKNAMTATAETGKNGTSAVAPQIDGYMTFKEGTSTDTYTVTVKWDRGESAWDAKTTDGYQGKSFYLSFDISGYQAPDEEITYVAETGDGTAQN
jgi:hypothetical protein